MTLPDCLGAFVVFSLRDIHLTELPPIDEEMQELFAATSPPSNLVANADTRRRFGQILAALA